MHNGVEFKCENAIQAIVDEITQRHSHAKRLGVRVFLSDAIEHSREVDGLIAQVNRNERVDDGDEAIGKIGCLRAEKDVTTHEKQSGPPEEPSNHVVVMRGAFELVERDHRFHVYVSFFVVVCVVFLIHQFTTTAKRNIQMLLEEEIQTRRDGETSHVVPSP